MTTGHHPSFLESFFRYTPVACAAVAGLSVLVVLAVKLSPSAAPYRSPSPKTRKIANPGVMPTGIPEATPAAIDLNGPYICRTERDSVIYDIHIKNNRFAAVGRKGGTVERYLFSGDCFYQWGAEAGKGRKICGLAPLMAFLTPKLSGQGGVMDMFMPVGDRQMGELRTLLQSCRKEDFAEGTLFAVPGEIVFAEEDISNLLNTGLLPR